MVKGMGLADTMLVLPEPKLWVVDGEYFFTGKAVDVTNAKTSGGYMTTTDCLRASGVYELEYDGGFGNPGLQRSCGNKFPVEMFYWDEDINTILNLIDVNKLKRDLKNNDYAFLKAKDKIPDKFKSHENNDFIARVDSVMRDTIYDRMPKYLNLDFSVRPFTTHEAVDLMVTDTYYMDVMRKYRHFNMEVIQEVGNVVSPSSHIKVESGEIKLTNPNVLRPKRVGAVWTNWGTATDGPNINTSNPLGWNADMIMALKRVE